MIASALTSKVEAYQRFEKKEKSKLRNSIRVVPAYDMNVLRNVCAETRHSKI